MTKIQILAENGIHARPASKIVNIVKNAESEVFLIKDGKKHNAKSIMSILGMGIKKGDEIEIDVTGSDSNEIESKLIQIFKEENA
ncbi:HPr family phosphocarrier protein [Clostridiaceae bacterium HSG29]|nr:HPr family phosphocarrier protein [Clostridiaceae bacterium HSG29]